MVRIADTSFLFAAFVAEDHHHETARREMRDPEPILVPTEILAELSGLVRRRFDKKQALRVVEALQNTPNVRIFSEVNGEAATRFYLASKGVLTLPDACVVHACRALAARPLAYDRRLKREASRQ